MCAAYALLKRFVLSLVISLLLPGFTIDHPSDVASRERSFLSWN